MTAKITGTKRTAKASRRSFIKAAGVTGAVAGVAAIAMPKVARGQASPITMRWQSTWPAKDIFH
ncbi:MAG: twin-arginine translocation signal domain-containing protein, partial [Alphaproteobacteria bacterium]|nr:twin-arginine translocation signal domain-containing protein [Alphaproteobacteria bacterium]